MIPAMKGRELVVLCGGTSAEREVSLDGAAAVLAALREGGYEPQVIDTAQPDWWRLLGDGQLAFNMQHGRGGEDGVTQGLLEALGVSYTGSGILGSALSMDKIRSKQLWRDAGLSTAEFVVVESAEDIRGAIRSWGSAFIKPASEGSSIGMSRVSQPEEAEAALLRARAQCDRVMAERFVDGPEYTVGILGDRALPAIRIEVDEGFYDYHAKYRSDSTRYLVPCGLEDAELAELADLSLAAFQALDCAVWGRVDLMREADGRFQLLEVNTVPGMTSHSLVPMAARAAGMSMPELLDTILDLSLAAREQGSD